MARSFEHSSPVPASEAEGIAQRWLRHGSLAITGPDASARTALAETLLRHRPPGTPVLTADVPASARPGTGWLLEELGLAPAHDAVDMPVSALAGRIAPRLGPTTILVQGAAAADPRSLRVLFSLARQDPGARLILLDEEGPTARDPRGAGLDAAIPVHLPAVQGDELARIASALVGAKPTFLDVAVLDSMAGGSFRALCWCLELGQRNGALEEFGGRFHLSPVDGGEPQLPPWTIREDLLASEAAMHLSLAGSLPIDAVEQLGLLGEVVALEVSGDVDIRDATVRLRSGAAAMEVAERQSEVGRRLRLRRLVEVLQTAAEQVAVDAVQLGTWLERSGLPLSAPIASSAVRSAAWAGRHGVAARLGAAAGDLLSPEAQLDLVHSLVVLDESDQAIGAARRLAARGDADVLEGLGMIMALAHLRRPDREAARMTLDELGEQYHREISPDGSAVLAACGRLLRPGPRVEEARLQLQETSSRSTVRGRRRALVLRAALAWTDGRPREAVHLLDELPEDAGAPAVDAGLEHLLRVAGTMLAPDLQRAADLLRDSIRSPSMSRTNRLIGSMLSIYQGDVAVARLLADPLIGPGDGCEDEVLAPLAAAISSASASMAGAPDLAVRSLDMAFDLQTPSLVIGVVVEHLRGIAATQLRPEGDHDAGLVSYAAAAMAARHLQFRLMETLASYRWAHELSIERRSELWDRLAEQLEGDRPLDGVPGLLARAARGIGTQDLPALVSMVSELQAVGLVQDAKVLSMWLVSRATEELPAVARRTVSRIARRRFSPGDVVARGDEDSVLTPKEREVAARILDGITDREIGEALGSSRRTVTTHVGRILRKLGLTGRHELTLELALRHGVRPVGRDAPRP